MSGKGMLIIIEGSDGSGKATQSELLTRRLDSEGIPVRKVTFPDYDSPSSSLIKMYLGGAFGEQADSVSPYVASTFYAADRYASYMTKWGKDYDGGAVIVSDRYTTSNMVHQGAKLTDPVERTAFFDWLADHEYRLYGLPVPDLVIFLDVPPRVSQSWRQDRRNKIDGTTEQDIHERDAGHLTQAYETAREVASRFGWVTVPAVEAGAVLDIDAIHQRVWAVVQERLRAGGRIE